MCCMYVHAYLHVWGTHACVHVPVCVRSLRSMLEIVLHWSFTLLIEAEVSQSNPELTNVVSLTNELVLYLWKLEL